MSSQFIGKTALIAGGSKGIDAATSLASARMEVIKQIGDDRALAVKDDAGSISAIKNMVPETVKRSGENRHPLSMRGNAGDEGP